MHGQLLTESIRFKVTLEVNVAGAGEEHGSKDLRFQLMEWIKWMQRHEMESKVVENYTNVTRFSGFMKS